MEMEGKKNQFHHQHTLGSLLYVPLKGLILLFLCGGLVIIVKSN